MFHFEKINYLKVKSSKQWNSNGSICSILCMPDRSFSPRVHRRPEYKHKEKKSWIWTDILACYVVTVYRCE